MEAAIQQRLDEDQACFDRESAAAVVVQAYVRRRIATGPARTLQRRMQEATDPRSAGQFVITLFLGKTAALRLRLRLPRSMSQV